MKKVYLLFVIFLALPLGISAGKGGKLQTVATLSVSPTVYVSGPISFTGSGYQPRKQVWVDVEGPTSQWFYFDADSNGNFDVTFGGVPYAPGYYTAVAHQSTTQTVLTATTGFEVQ
jgi:hypothetical protein